MAKISKSAVKAKSTVGSTKKPINKTKTLMLSACAALLLLSTAYAGVMFMQQRSLKAKAAGYTPLPMQGYYGVASFYACKKTINSAYGPLFEVRGLVSVKNLNPSYRPPGYDIKNRYQYFSLNTYKDTSGALFQTKTTKTSSTAIPRSQYVSGVYVPNSANATFSLWLNETGANTGGFPPNPGVTGTYQFYVNRLTECS